MGECPIRRGIHEEPARCRSVPLECGQRRDLVDLAARRSTRAAQIVQPIPDLHEDQGPVSVIAKPDVDVSAVSTGVPSRKLEETDPTDRLCHPQDELLRSQMAGVGSLNGSRRLARECRGERPTERGSNRKPRRKRSGGPFA
jgi:hypothetical protein